MLRYMKRHYVLVLLALIISIIAQMAAPVSAIVEQRMIDFIVNGDMAGFWQTLWVAALIVLGLAVAYYLTALTKNKFQALFTEELSNDLYDGIMRKGSASFNEQDTAEYISVIDNDVSTMVNNFTSPVWVVVGAAFSGIATLAVMFVYNPLLAAIAVASSLLSFIVPLFLTKSIKKRLIEKTVYDAALSVQLKEALNGHEVVSAFDVLPQVRTRFMAANRQVNNAFYRFGLVISVLENSSMVLSKVVWFITFLVAGGMAISGQLSVGTLVMFISLYRYFSSDVSMLSQVIPLLRGCKPVIDKLVGIIDYKDNAFTGTEEPSFTDKIDVTHLSFQYKEGFPILTDLNLTIRKNEKLALVGASGCGKSTFIKLLSGNYATYQGGIYYDGVELRQLDNQKLRKRVTVIHQKTYIFNDTIRYNICLGEEFSQSDFSRALKLSGVEKFLPQITDGVDGQCGEDGVNLSGGQKQRIALARALVRGIDILILDEGVSAIDVETANEIEQELLDMKNLTLLTITHRIKDGLIQRYDRVLSMAGGKLAEKEK